MIELKTKLRKWGNSFGVVVPQRIVEKENVSEGDEITIFLVGERVNLRKLFGAHKFKKPTSQMMKEVDRDLDSDF